MATKALEIVGLHTEIRTRRATVRAVDGVSLSVAPGQTVGLVGESGCGKSMTGLSVLRLLPTGGRIAAGTVHVGGTDVTALPEKRMRTIRGNEVAMIFQDPSGALNPTLSIGEQVAEPVRVHRGASRRQALDRAAEMLDLVGVPDARHRLDALPHQLSGGLRQRVAIAIALACEPKVVIADEPTTALDVTTQAQILDLLDELKTRLRMGLLLVTHDMGVVAERADDVAVMYAGRLVEQASTSRIFGATRHPYTAALLDSIPDVELGRGQRVDAIPGLPPDLAAVPPGCRFAPRCGRAQDRCRGEEPRLDAGPAEHRYACFFPLDPASTRRVSGTGDDTGRPTGEPLLVVDHAVKEFPVAAGPLRRRRGSVSAVADVSLQVHRGETLGLVGESGCGKSTLARLIVGLERLDAGTIRFAGEELSGLRGRALRRRRRSLQLVFQDPYASLDPRMRVLSSLREPLVAQGIGTRAEQQRTVGDLLAAVGLPAGSTGLYPHEFSGGQRQRIGFARVLTLEPELIVADEPVSALDVSVQAQVLNLMKRLQADRDLTYVVISHDLSVLRYLADRIGVMYLGQLVEIGPAERIYGRAAHPYTAGLLDAIPVPDPARARAERPTIRGELPSALRPPSGCRFRTRCPRVQDRCATEAPPMRTFADGHTAACHFPLQEAIA